MLTVALMLGRAGGAQSIPDFSTLCPQCPGCLGADLTLTVDDARPSTSRGTINSYKLAYTNHGADVASGVVITATVPASSTFDPTDSSSAWRQVGSSSTYTLSLPDLDPAKTGTVTFAVTVSTTAPIGAVISFSASIADDGLHGPDVVPDNSTGADNDLVTRGPTFECGNITQDTTWQALDGPFIITCDLVIPAGVTLTIEPGTVVKFNSLIGMKDSGTLAASGTATQAIVFTSNRSRLRKGDWRSIDVLSGGKATFDYATVEYAGSTTALVFVAVGGTATVRHSTLQQSQVYGLWSQNGTATVEDSTISDNNNVGVWLQSNSATNASRLVNNVFNKNLNYPILLDYGNGTLGEVRGNSGTGNSFQGIWVQGTLAGTNTWGVNNGLAYRIGSSPVVAAGASLTLEAGTVVKLTSSQQIFVDGTFTAVGTAEQPVVFTSFKDDSYGGDTNADASNSLPAAGDWGQIYFRSASHGNQLVNTIVAYGGGTFLTGVVSEVRSDVEDLAVQSCVIRDSRQIGLYLPSAAHEVRDSRFENNHFSDGLNVSLSGTKNLLITGNTFRNNGGHAVFLSLGNAAGSVTFSGNAASGNAINGAGIQGTVAGDFTIDESGQVNF